MPQEVLYLAQMLNSAGIGWLPAVLLTGLLLALLFKPENVHSWPLFRLSCWLLAISIIVMPLLNVLISFTQGNSMGSRFPNGLQGMPPFIIAFIYAISPILQGISIICGLLSMIPSGSRQYLAPPKHPLE
jgi:hypothetical protein